MEKTEKAKTERPARPRARKAVGQPAPAPKTSPVAKTSEPAVPPQKGQIISRILRDEIVPVIEKHGVSRILLGREHLAGTKTPPGITLTSRGSLGPEVRRRGHALKILARWPEDEMEAPRFPCICFVYAGEADIPVGDVIVHCPAGHLILIPPGVPVTEGRAAHWCRPHSEKAYSDIFWMQLRPFGAECHTCHTRGLQHESGGYGRHYVVTSRQFFPLIEQLIEELSEERPFAAAIGSSYLLALLGLMQRHCGDEPSPSATAAIPIEDVTRNDLGDPQLVIRRAQQYIESNLGKHLTLQIIARAAYVSRARLAQLFKAHLDKTVWDYVVERRLQEAKSMLAETDLNTNDISRLSGFNHPSHFFARFAELTGLSPGEFRRQARDRQGQKKRR